MPNQIPTEYYTSERGNRVYKTNSIISIVKLETYIVELHIATYPDA